MNLNSDFKDLLQCLNNEKVEYLIVGGYAVIHHSEPRYTKDIDVWIKPTKENAAAVYRALSRFGAPLAALGIETRDFEKEGYFVQFGNPPSRVDILMSVKGITFDTAWNNRITAKYGDIQAQFISKEDLILAKRASARPQDLVDADLLEQSKKWQK